jgi:PAS domain S-box-containing protein
MLSYFLLVSRIHIFNGLYIILNGYLTICFLTLFISFGLCTIFFYRKYIKAAKNNILLPANNTSYQEILNNLRNQEFLLNFTNYLNSSGSFKNKINNALNILGKYTGVSKIYIFEDYGSGKMTCNTFEWCKTGVIPEKEKYTRVIYNSQLLNWKSLLIKDGIIFFNNIEQIPPDLQSILIPRGTKSILVFPLYIHNDFYGFAGLDRSEAHTWNNTEINFLKTISMILSNTFERLIAEEEIKDSEIKFKDLFNHSSDAIFIYNAYGEILEVNNRACEALELSREELIKRNIELVFSPGNIPYDMLFFNKDHLEVQVFECEFITASARTFPVEINNRPINFNNKKALLCVARDISERKLMEREILSTIIQTEEKERGRIARDLHDGLGPLLSSLKLYVKVLGNTQKTKKSIEILKTSNEVIDESLQLIKEISNNLSPHVLNDFGLASAIQSFCKKMTLTKAIDIKFDSNVYDQRFETNVELVLFRVLKELVNNTIKHALANRIEIFLIRTENLLSLIYSDDGTGFDIKRVLDNHITGMGISNIINRIGSINGKLMFESQPEKGIQVKIGVTLKK